MGLHSNVNNAALLVAVDEPTELVEFGIETSLEEVLEEGIRRLQEKETWKVWQYQGVEVYDADTFRQHMHEHHFKEELLRLLPKDDPKGTERPAEAAFRQRMAGLLQTVQSSSRQGQEDVPAKNGKGGRHRATQQELHAAVKDGNIEMISTMLGALEQVSACAGLTAGRLGR
jgi:hypothetical protein